MGGWSGMNIGTIGDQLKIFGIILMIPIWLITYLISLIIFGIKSKKKKDAA